MGKDYKKGTRTKECTDKSEGVYDKVPGGMKDTPRGKNHIGWFVKNPNLVRDFANIIASYPSGKGIPEAKFIRSSNTAMKVRAKRTAGIMSIKYIPCFGVTGEITADGLTSYDNSIMNTCALRWFWDVIHANSRRVTYDKNDLMMFLFNITQIWIMLADAVRAYGIAHKFSTINRYLGSALLKACGWDPDFIYKNISDFRGQINRLIHICNNVKLPKLFDIIPAHLEPVTYVYADGRDPRAQMYVMTPSGYYKYSDAEGKATFESHYTIDPSKTYKMMPAWYSLSGYKQQEYLDAILEAIMELQNSEYMGVIDGDLMKRYGEDNMVSFPEVPEDYEVPIVYDEEFLVKLENADFLGRYDNKGGVVMLPIAYYGRDDDDVSELENRIIQQIDGTTYGTSVSIAMRAPYGDPIKEDNIVLNLPDAVEPNSETFMLVTRYKFLANYITLQEGTVDAHLGFEVISAGTQVFQWYDVMTFEGNVLDHDTVSGFLYEEGNPQFAEVFSRIKQFRVMPKLFVTSSNAGYVQISDVDQFAVVSRENIERINWVALDSLFTADSIGPYGWAAKA